MEIPHNTKLQIIISDLREKNNILKKEVKELKKRIRSLEKDKA